MIDCVFAERTQFIPAEETWNVRSNRAPDPICFIAISLAYLVRIARPGGERWVSTLLMSLPSAAAVVAVIISLLLTPMPDWRALIFGQQWLFCLMCIPLNAIPPFAAVGKAHQALP